MYAAMMVFLIDDSPMRSVRVAAMQLHRTVELQPDLVMMPASQPYRDGAWRGRDGCMNSHVAQRGDFHVL